jgi:hypothetical protein
MRCAPCSFAPGFSEASRAFSEASIATPIRPVFGGAAGDIISNFTILASTQSDTKRANEVRG